MDYTIDPLIIAAAISLAQAAYKYNIIPSKLRPLLAVLASIIVSAGFNLSDPDSVSTLIEMLLSGAVNGSLGVAAVTVTQKTAESAKEVSQKTVSEAVDGLGHDE